MRRLATAVILVVAGLGGCAAPQGHEKMSWDAANCVRHAKEGPGGPSAMVGSNLNIMPASRRQASIAAVALMKDRVTAPSSPETIYLDCMRVRGHDVTFAPGRPLNPERIGALPRLRL
jgi:hypothetical protein